MERERILKSRQKRRALKNVDASRVDKAMLVKGLILGRWVVYGIKTLIFFFPLKGNFARHGELNLYTY